MLMRAAAQQNGGISTPDSNFHADVAEIGRLQKLLLNLVAVPVSEIFEDCQSEQHNERIFGPRDRGGVFLPFDKSQDPILGHSHT